MSQYKFKMKNLEDLKKKLTKLDLSCPMDEDLDVLGEEVKVGENIIPNRLAVHPMEGADANPDGTPGDLTLRRYKRYAAGGAGMIWFEAIAINKFGRANDQQLYLNQDTVEAFKDLINEVRAEAKDKHSDDFDPYLVIQLTHAGRFGEHNKILFHHDLVDEAPAASIDKDQEVMTDEELASLEDDFVQAAKLAKQAGFDAVDIKACHRYLLSENLAAHTRNGKYGGEYENRTRVLKNAVKKVKAEVDIDIAVRLNGYDAIAYPYGWGTDREGNQDLTEPKRLVHELNSLGVKIINITAATPYLWPHINRPYDLPGNLGYESPEHPLTGVMRLLRLARGLQQEVKDCVIVGTGYSWLRHLAPQVAAGIVNEGWAQMIGFGRQAFAYPDFAHDILENGELDSSKVCVTCSKCAELKAKKKKCGCVVRDKEVYLPIYQELLEEYKQDK